MFLIQRVPRWSWFWVGYSFAAELLPESPDCKRDSFPARRERCRQRNDVQWWLLLFTEGKKYNKRIFWLPLRTGDLAPPLSGAEGTRVRSLYLPMPGCWTVGDIRDILQELSEGCRGGENIFGLCRSPTDDEGPSRFIYFKFGIDIPEGAASLILPKNEKVVLFAATLVESSKPIGSSIQPSATISGWSWTMWRQKKENLLKSAKIIAYSGYFNDNEKPGTHRWRGCRYQMVWSGKCVELCGFWFGWGENCERLETGECRPWGQRVLLRLLPTRQKQPDWRMEDTWQYRWKPAECRITYELTLRRRYAIVRLMITRPMQHAGRKGCYASIEVELYWLYAVGVYSSYSNFIDI